jgi:hypothetical protein
VRLAVAPAGQINDPMLLRVPPASIRNLGEYGQMLAKRGVGYNMVVTKVGFDMEAESPKLTFKPVGFLDEDGFAQVREALDSLVVADILGASPAAVEAAPAKQEPVKEAPKAAKSERVSEDAAEEVVKAAEKPKAEKPKAEKAKVVEEDDVELDLDGISFDD